MSQSTEATSKSAGGPRSPRERWRRAYRRARIIAASSPNKDEVLARLEGLDWTAWTVVCWKRDREDPLSLPVNARLEARSIADELAPTRS